MRLLLIEDSEADFVEIRDVIRRHPPVAKVEWAREIPEVIDGGVNLVILDLHLPGCDGIACYERLMSVLSGRNVPVLVCTWSTDPDLLSALSCLGATVVSKDRILEGLRPAAEAALSMSPAPEELNGDWFARVAEDVRARLSELDSGEWRAQCLVQADRLRAHTSQYKAGKRVGEKEA